MKPGRQAILPAYVFLCILVGGSTQAVWGNAILQLLAIAILGWAALTWNPLPLNAAGRRLLWIVVTLVLLFGIQLLPLPPQLWTGLPARQFVAHGFGMLGTRPPWMPISLAPYDTLTTAMTLLPPLAVLVGMLRLRAWSAGWALSAVLAGAVVSIVLGVLQVTIGADGSWYFYRVTNLGVAVGTFANGNHFATLLLAAIPALVALAVSALRATEDRQRRSVEISLAAAGAALLAIGILINNSTAFLLLAPPVAAASALLAIRLSPRRLRQAWLAIVLVVVVAGIGTLTVGQGRTSGGTGASIETREEFWMRTVKAIEDHALSGSGFGTFEKIYQRYEDPAEIDRYYVNHAHNDYLEIALEGGAPAVLLLLIFLAWWLRRSLDAWAPSGSVEQRAAMIASAAILLHSLIDFPLRTTAITAVMAACLAMLSGARGIARDERMFDRRPARHATL